MLSSAGLSRWFWDVWVACGPCRPLMFLSLPHGLTCKDSLHHHFFLKRSREQYFQSLDIPHGAVCCSIISSGMPQSQDSFSYECKNLCGVDLKASRKRLRKHFQSSEARAESPQSSCLSQHAVLAVHLSAVGPEAS